MDTRIRPKKEAFSIVLFVALLPILTPQASPASSPEAEWAQASKGASTEKTVASISTKWDLWSNGTHLRGVNIIQRRVNPELDGDYIGSGPMGAPFTQDDFDRLAALGANYINISYTGLFSEKPPYSADTDVQDGLDRLLEMIGEADLFGVISLRSGPGRSEFALYYWDGLETDFYDDTVWKSQAAQDGWIEMWRTTAERYKDNPVVVGYDLMVEPNSNDSGADALNAPLEIWEPDEFHAQYGGTLYDWNQLYPHITAAIREVDSETPILVAGNSYSGVRWLPYIEPTDDARTVYVVHQYEPQSQYTHKDWAEDDFAAATYPGTFDLDWDDVDDTFDRAWLDSFLTIVDTFQTEHGVPVAANEYGVLRWVKNADAFMRDQMELFEERGMNHAFWEWQPLAWQADEEDDGFNFRYGPDPNNHSDVETSDLLEVILQNWSRNTIRPSTMPSPGTAVEDYYLYE